MKMPIPPPSLSKKKPQKKESNGKLGAPKGHPKCKREDPEPTGSIEYMEEALKHGKIKQCISDHSTQFIKTDKESKFKDYLEAKGIKQILCRVKHPQSNGKIEKWFDIYKNHRHAFETKEEFLKWYNEIRPHRALKFDILETPQEAFIRKMKAEV